MNMVYINIHISAYMLCVCIYKYLYIVCAEIYLLYQCDVMVGELLKLQLIASTFEVQVAKGDVERYVNQIIYMIVYIFI